MESSKRAGSAGAEELRAVVEVMRVDGGSEAGAGRSLPVNIPCLLLPSEVQ